MNDHIVHFVGNRSPSLYGTILIDGAPVNLTGSTVKFQMREHLSETGDPLIVDTAAVVVTPADGQVRYDWAANDVDTSGFYTGWWRVTLAGGQIQDTPEFLLEIREHASAGTEYVSVAELKESLSMGNTTYADADYAGAVVAASRIVDDITGRTFTAAGTPEDRYYTPVSDSYLLIDPFLTITAIEFQGTAVTFADATSEIYQDGNALRSVTRKFPRNRPVSVKVTGTFGETGVPEEVKAATKIIAAQLVQRIRQATFGVVATTIEGGAIRLSQYDPQVDALLAKYTIPGQMIE